MLPFNDRSYVRNVYGLPGSSHARDAPPYIIQPYSKAEVAKWAQENNATIEEQKYWQFRTGNHRTVGEQVKPPKK